VTSVHDHLRHRFRWKVHSNHRICPSSLESHQSLDHDPWDLTNQRPSRGSASKINKSQKRRKSTVSWNFLLHTTSCHYTIPVQTLLLYFFYVIIKQGAQDMQRKRRTVLKLLGRRPDLYLSHIMFTCSALFGKGLASSGGWNQAYCSAECARIGVFLPSGLDVCFLLYLLSLKIPRSLRGKIYVFVWGGR
jgi:hypothetical protein